MNLAPWVLPLTRSVVERVQHREEGADREHIVVLGEPRHLEAGLLGSVHAFTCLDRGVDATSILNI